MGHPEPLIAQTFYESVAEAIHRGISPNTLILLQPGAPYACIGYHQDIEKEIDLEFVKSNALPVIRRSQGGGATYLDGNQLFYQIIAKESAAVPREVDAMFRKLLAVTVETYRQLGVPAEYKPLNDVIVNGKKISGNGASLHESASILVGNIILDMNYELMARVLKVPDEKFRDKMAKSMRDWVTTLKRETSTQPDETHVKEVYVDAFQRLLGVNLSKSQPTPEEWKIYNEETRPRNLSHEWLFMEAPYSTRRPGRAVKIAHDIKVVEVDHKAGKLIRVRAEMKGDEILGVQLSGDFFSTPKEAVFDLERKLEGAKLNEAELTRTVEGFYKSSRVEIPGITSGDFVQALLKIKASL